MSIEVNGVSKFYGRQKALNAVSFSISRGEVVGFLGPNGAGKSTMMKIITGYIPPSEGKVSVCQADVQEKGLQSRRFIGYLPEHNPLYTEMYVREYLSFIGDIYGVRDRKKRVEEMIELVGLGSEAHKKIEALSKGYRQRVGLAQALIHDPEVLILDEPTSGLDPNQLSEIRSLITSIGKEKTVMLSTHIMQEVEAICSRTIIINKGEIVADQSTSTLRMMESGGTIELFVEFSEPVAQDMMLSLPGVISVSPAGVNGWTVTTLKDGEARKSLSDLARQQDISLITLMRKEQNLESVFKELTQRTENQVTGS